jgi:glycosyltransferase involved in cell wall biosynthesis
MKILLYTPDINIIGGIETSFYNLAIYLSKKHDVGVRYNSCSHVQTERYREAGIDIQPQQRESCDVLILGSMWSNPRLIQAKVVGQQVHADWTDSFWGDLTVWQQVKTAAQRADIFLPVSNSAGEYIKRYVDTPILTMNNLAPAKDKKLSRPDKLVIAAFTRMTHEKGASNYIALAKRLIELDIQAELRFYTNGDVPNGWTRHNTVKDIRKELKDVSYVASLADTESFGYTMAEANSMGIPCIIKRANSTAEFFKDSDNIILNDVRDITANDLARSIQVDYTLDKSTKKSVDSAIKILTTMTVDKCIIQAIRQFTDLETGRPRQIGDIFVVDTRRAKELLNNPNNIVRKL